MEQDFELNQEKALTLTQESVNHGVKTFDSNKELEYEVTQRINRMMVKSLGHTNVSAWTDLRADQNLTQIMTYGLMNKQVISSFLYHSCPGNILQLTC